MNNRHRGFNSIAALECVAEISQENKSTLMLRHPGSMTAHVKDETGVLYSGPIMCVFNGDDSSLVAAFVSAENNIGVANAMLFATIVEHSTILYQNYMKMRSALQSVTELSNDDEILNIALNALTDEIYFKDRQAAKCEQ